MIIYNFRKWLKLKTVKCNKQPCQFNMDVYLSKNNFPGKAKGRHCSNWAKRNYEDKPMCIMHLREIHTIPFRIGMTDELEEAIQNEEKDN